MRNRAPVAPQDVVASVLILLMLAVAFAFWAADTGLYRQIIREDGPVEWMTFWAFALAGVLSLLALAREASLEHPLRTLYLAAFALGALAVAMEEISWGQRLFGFQPPERFLADNFQQELNLHNLADSATRKGILTALLIGFGILFPVVARLPRAGRLLEQWMLPAPSLALIPGFVALVVVYLLYPIDSTGEWVELGAGLCFFFAALGYPGKPNGSSLLLLGSTPLLLGAVTPLLLVTPADPKRIETATLESQALAQDFKNRRLRSRCGVHKRIYTFVQDYGAGNLARGAWGQLDFAEGADALRREYFLDPWNQPYWIWHVCSGDRPSVVFVYSFGPDRRRDSSRDGVIADDVGAYAYRATD